jgi:cytoskeletal protein CcmA (bactofilin family)
MFSRKKQPPIRSLIADGTHIEGNLRFADGLRVDGSVRGDVRAEAGKPSLLVISETALVQGEVHADHVVVNGTVKGPVYAATILELQPKARIEGDVHYAALEMHQGALIAGQLLPTVEGRVLHAIDEKPPLKLAANNS